MARRRARQSRASGKERAADVPSWLNEQPEATENGNDFAKRMMDKRYGAGKDRLPEYLYLLYRVRQSPDSHDQVQLLSVYSTRAKAVQTRKRLQQQRRLGSRTHLEIGVIRPDSDHWTEGYVTVPPPDRGAVDTKTRVKPARIGNK
jgi:hypothetical protein